MVLWGLLLIVGVSVVAAGLVLVVERLLPKEHREGDVEAIGFVFAVVGVLYAIVLAFVVIDVWTKMSAAEADVYREANALVEEYRYAEGLADTRGAEIQRLSRAYATLVVEGEWPQMRNREPVGLEGYALLDRLRDAIETSRPGDTAEQAYVNAVAHAQTLVQAREARLAAASAGVPSVLWFVLLGGALLIIGFAYLFDVNGIVTRMILAVGLTCMTTLLLWCIFQMEYPFARQLRIDSDAFEFALMRFGQISRGG